MTAEGYETLSTDVRINLNDLVYLNFTLQKETGGSSEEFIYHTHEEVEDFLNRMNAQFPDLTALYSIGKSVEGKAYVVTF